jgi:PBSX family phage portal protein
MKKSESFIVTTDEDGEHNLISSEILEQYAIKADVNADGTKQIRSDGWDYNQLLEPLYDPKRLAELLDLYTYHELCCDAVASDSAGSGYTFNPVSSNETSDSKFENKEVLNFFDNLEPGINEILYKRMYDRRALGYGAIEIVRESTSESVPVSLQPIQAHTLRRHKDEFRVKQKVGTKEVWFVLYGKNRVDGVEVDVDADTGEICPYNSLPSEKRANELLWTEEYTPRTPFYGRPRIVGSLPAIQGDLSRASYNNAFFSNYGVPAFAVTVTGDFVDYDVEPDDPDYDYTKTLKYKISQQLKEVMKHPHSAVTILVPSEGEEGNVEVNLQQLSVDSKEASFRLYRSDNRDEVINAHKVPPYRVGVNITGTLGGNNSEISDEIYKDGTIAPLVRANEDDINLLLKNEFGVYDWKFELEGINQKDTKAEFEIAKSLVEHAAMTPNELRTYFGETYGLTPSEDPLLDMFYMNGKPLEDESVDLPAANDMVLSDLENSLWSVDDEQETREDSEDSAIQKAFKSLKRFGPRN